jgi:KDO2-lipid IV(A) lauroyltransferase
LENRILVLVLILTGWVPMKWHRPAAILPALFFYYLVPFRRGILRENLQIAFGSVRGVELKSIVRRIYIRAVEHLFELAWLRRATPDEINRAVEQPVEGLEHLDHCHEKQTGMLMASAHFGNWEWLIAFTSLRYGSVGVIYKPIHNSLTDRELREIRQRFGARCYSTRDKRPRPLMEFIRKGGAVCIMGDQDARHHGVFLPFFGQPTSTVTGPASLAVRHGIPIVFGYNIRTGPGHFRLKILPPINPDPHADREQEVIRIMTLYNQMVEKAILDAPDQYFWWHRRWKTRP